MSGDYSRLAVGEEAAYGATYADANIVQAIRLIDGADMNIDPAFATADELTGKRLKGKDYKGVLKGTGAYAFLASPQGGLGWHLKWLCGAIQDLAGSYHPRVKVLTAVGAETEIDFSAFTTNPVNADNHSLFVRHANGTKTPYLKSATATIAAGEYYLDETGETITVGAPLVAGDEVILTWIEDVAGVYTHIFKDYRTLRSYQSAFRKGEVKKFDYNGIGINTMNMNINTTDLLQGEFDLLFKDEALEDPSGWPTLKTNPLYPAFNTKDPLDPFLIQHCKIIMDQIQTTDVSAFNVSYSNNLEPYDSIQCTDTTSKLVTGEITLTVSVTQEFTNSQAREDFRALTLRDWEFRYGECPAPKSGVQIGTTGVNYMLGLWIPAGQYTSNACPASSGVLAEEVEITAKEDIELDDTLEWYLVNSVVSYPDAT